MLKVKRGVFAYFGMDPVMGMTKSGAAELMDMMAVASLASKVGFGSFRKKHSDHFELLLLPFKLV